MALALAFRLASSIPDPALKDDLCRLIDRVTGATGKKDKSCLNRVICRLGVQTKERYGISLWQRD